MSRTTIILLAGLAIFVADCNGDVLECTRENEEYQCGSACQTTCMNWNTPCPIVNVRCNDDCYCKKGFARENDYDSPCIPIRDCLKQKMEI